MTVGSSSGRLLLIIAVLFSPLAVAQTLPPGGSDQAVQDLGSAYVVEAVNGTSYCRDATPEEAVGINARPGVDLRIFGEDRGRIRKNGNDGLNIVLRGTAQLDANPEAKAAFERAAEIWEERITNPVTVIVDVDFGPLRFGEPYPENVIASASTHSFIFDEEDYDYLRELLANRADSAAELALYSALPVGAVPTDVPAGALKQLVAPSILLRTLGVLPQFPPVATPDDELGFPNIGFNSQFKYDFDPSNGIAPLTKDFEGVVVHELGHMLGFTSRVGAGELGATDAPTILDLFRFRPGITLDTFTSAQRILTTGGNQVFFAGGPELALSTGNPRGDNGDGQQASHWKDDAQAGGVRIGIMDPTLGNARRSELTDNDLAAFGILGYTLSTDVQEPEPQAPNAPTGLTATAVSTTSVRLDWNDNSDNETEFRIEQKNEGGVFLDVGTAALDATMTTITSLVPGSTTSFRVRARNAVGDSSYTNEANATTNVEPSVCAPNSTTVCLLNDRFKVVIDYVNPFSTPPNQPGTFIAARLLVGVQNPDTALFGFDSAQAVEVVVRIQDTRPFGADRFDIYYGGMTDVGYTVTVTDTETGVVRRYTNTAGNVGGGVDRASFPASAFPSVNATLTSGGTDSFTANGTVPQYEPIATASSMSVASNLTASATSTCAANATTACLLSDRFKVVIDFVNPFSTPPNQPGTFLAARLLEGVQNPDTALFGFGSPQAVEVVVRIQDARPFAPRFDVYFGGMTDVGYTVTVTDTVTGTVRSYQNVAGNVGGGVDRASFPTN